jgi:hypothetical protein
VSLQGAGELTANMSLNWTSASAARFGQLALR